MIRPVLRYHGGKHKIAEWVISHFPPHKCYVEPFAGAASVLMRKPRVAAEVLNDLDDRIVNVFRVLREPSTAIALRRQLELTPFSRAELLGAYEPSEDPIEQARRTVALSFMGQGSDAVTRGFRTGFRCKLRNGGNNALPSHDWANWPPHIPAFIERLQGVSIESVDALLLIRRIDTPDTLFYIDPPYPLSTRSAARSKHGYRHEMTDDDHRLLARVLHECEGMVVLSGYACELYDDELYGDWRRSTRETFADRGQARTEVVWMNEACAAAQRQHRFEYSSHTSGEQQ